RYVMVVVVYVFLMALSHSESLAQISSTVHGTVRLAASADSPVIVRIRLEKFGVPVQELVPNENRFEFMNVEEGRYMLIAAAPGYRTVQQEIMVPGDHPSIELQPDSRAIVRAEAVPVWDLKIPKSARRQFATATSELRQNHCETALQHLKNAIRAYAQ